jgi:hypothetical protein
MNSFFNVGDISREVMTIESPVALSVKSFTRADVFTNHIFFILSGKVTPTVFCTTINESDVNFSI